MSDYRQYFVPGGTYFFTIVTYQWQPIFSDPANVDLLRQALSDVKQSMSFDINAAVVLPDHMHFSWSLPPGDADFSKRIGRFKVNFTQALAERSHLQAQRSESRKKHRESNVWQRRFWEHVVRDEDEFESFFNYIHFNPVKHGLVSCPHMWDASSFHHRVNRGVLSLDWGCSCKSNKKVKFEFKGIQNLVGE